MAGAAAFLGTNLFNTLDQGISLISHGLAHTGNSAVQSEIADFWNSFTQLFLKLKSQKRQEKSKQIDDAINLLYFASGVLYHRINELSGNVPEQDVRLIGVEPLHELLTLCRWTQAHPTVKGVFDSLPQAMRKASERLQ